MGRNEIKLRRKAVSAGNLQRYRNYSALMQRHERYRKLRWISLLAAWFIVIVLLCLLLFWYNRIQKEQHQKKIEQKGSVTSMVYPPPAKR